MEIHKITIDAGTANLDDGRDEERRKVACRWSSQESTSSLSASGKDLYKDVALICRYSLRDDLVNEAQLKEISRQDCYPHPQPGPQLLSGFRARVQAFPANVNAPMHV